MIEMAKSGEYWCCKLEAQDWGIYLGFVKKVCDEQKAADGIDIFETMIEKARASFFTEEYIPFGLFHDHNIIGYAHVVLPGPDSSIPKINGSYISQSYTGRKLGDLLCAARFRYLMDHTCYNIVQTEIWKQNGRSISVVKRNGFEVIQQPAANGPDYLVFQKSLDRQTPNSAFGNLPSLGMEGP